MKTGDIVETDFGPMKLTELYQEFVWTNNTKEAVPWCRFEATCDTQPNVFTCPVDRIKEVANSG
jgi:hypothetical protein